MKKLALLVMIFAFFACSSPERKLNLIPSAINGCTNVPEVRNRLACIGRLVKQLERIHNAEVTVEIKDLDRIDSEYVNTLELYCFTSKDTKEKFLCFESEMPRYDPTLIGRVVTFGKQFGLGLVIGFVTGLRIPLR